MCRQVNQVAHVIANHRLVGGHYDDLEPVNLLEFEGFCVGRTGHAGELVVQPEVILEGNRSDGLVFVLDADAFLGLDRLMQAL